MCSKEKNENKKLEFLYLDDIWQDLFGKIIKIK